MSKKKIKPLKPILPDNDNEEEEEEDFQIKFPTKCILRIGEIEIATNKGSLKSCQRIAESCLKKKSIKNYLDIYNKKKVLGLSSPDYIG